MFAGPQKKSVKLTVNSTLFWGNLQSAGSLCLPCPSVEYNHPLLSFAMRVQWLLYRPLNRGGRRKWLSPKFCGYSPIMARTEMFLFASSLGNPNFFDCRTATDGGWSMFPFVYLKGR